MLLLTALRAQDFITRGKIEFEVKRNNKRMQAASGRSNNAWLESMPEFDVSYRELLFSYNQLLYRPGRRSTSPSWRNSNDNSVYTDLDKQKLVARKLFFENDAATAKCWRSPRF